MRGPVVVLALGALVLGGWPVPGFADDRAEWGVAVAAGSSSASLLVRGAQGFRLVAVDSFATIVTTSNVPLTLSDIQPGDRIDYAVTTWAGMDVVEMLRVTPQQRAHAAR